MDIKGKCSVVPFTIDRYTFRIDCYIFPLSGIDMVLGVTWLSTLGDITANWVKLTMDFTVDGTSRSHLRGSLPNPQGM